MTATVTNRPKDELVDDKAGRREKDTNKREGNRITIKKGEEA